MVKKYSTTGSIGEFDVLPEWKRSYPELEGKEIIWVGEGDNFQEVGVVVGCDYDIGVTIVNAEDLTEYLSCYNGPMSPRFIGKWEPKELEAWDVKFQELIACISEGLLDVGTLPRYRKGGGNPTAVDCPFSQ